MGASNVWLYGKQIVVAAGGAEHVLETEGLTQASHARRGFFQLLWVAGLAVALVGSLRSVRVIDPERGRDRFAPLALLTLVLTLVIAAISVQRLGLYVGSFGLTPLRLWALAGTAAVGLTIVTFAASVAGVGSEKSWFPGAVLCIAFALVFGLNAVNPDATVARYNISQMHSIDLDVGALTNLSDDAVPTIVERLNTLNPDLRSEAIESLCSRFDRTTSFGLLEYNVAAVGADNSLDQQCGVRPEPSNRGWSD